MERVILDLESKGTLITRDVGFAPIKIQITLKNEFELKTFFEAISIWDDDIADKLAELIAESIIEER